MHLLAVRRALALGLLIACTAACKSEQINLTPMPPEHYEKLGRADAEVCGNLYAILPWHQFAPWGLNERVDRAYAAAVASVDGASMLTDVTFSERWYWWGLASARCTRIQGEAIR